MKHTILALALLSVAAPVVATDLGISINIGEPGFFGQINIGNMAPPPMIFAQPVIVERQSGYQRVDPIYLRVPPGHEKHWDKHCREYNACGRPVYFVRDDWYRNEYAPRYRGEQHGEHEGHGQGDGHRAERGDERHDHGDHDHDHDRGNHDHGDRDNRDN